MSQSSTFCGGLDGPQESIAVASVAQDHDAESMTFPGKRF
jgi:hypothetical protein